MSDEESIEQLKRLLAQFPNPTSEQRRAITEYAMSRSIEAYLETEYRKAAESVRRSALEEQLATAEAGQKPRYKQVIERYNRAHGQNKKITLKQICDEMNVDYASIRVMKSRDAKRKKPKRSS